MKSKIFYIFQISNIQTHHFKQVIKKIYGQIKLYNSHKNKHKIKLCINIQIKRNYKLNLFN